jgi:hypothetical protein
MDRTMRHWTLADGYWHCMDSVEIAKKSRLGEQCAFIIAVVGAVAWGAYNLRAHHI